MKKANEEDAAVTRISPPDSRSTSAIADEEQNLRTPELFLLDPKDPVQAAFWYAAQSREPKTGTAKKRYMRELLLTGVEAINRHDPRVRAAFIRLVEMMLVTLAVSRQGGGS